MPAPASTSASGGRTPARAYSASLTQAAAAIFGVAVVDGAASRPTTVQKIREKQ